jgi:alkylation response protein AidB-like acyl-CoA dehydrogenase
MDVTTDGFSAKLQKLLPGVRGRREEIETGRKLPHDLVEALTATGVFALAVPRALGGSELDPLDQTRVIEEVSAADGSTGWCTMIALGDGIFAGCMNEPGAKEIFTAPFPPTAASIAPAGRAMEVDGGVRVSGRWRFASGIDHADWVLAGCVVMDGGAPRLASNGMPEILHVFLPKGDVRVHDTWYVSGLCGTGSHDFEADDVFVPEHRIVSLFDATRHRPEPLYQMPLLALFAPHVAAVGLGIARAALEELNGLAVEKTPTFSAARLADKPVTQVELAKAEAALGGARAFLFDSLEDLWQRVAAGREPTRRQLAICRISAIQATETAARVTRTVSTIAGGTSVYSSSPLQRHARDADAITHHVTQSPQMWEECGRVLLGLDPLFPIF